MTRTTSRWVVSALVALLAAWLLAPAVLPIYDGIGNPDEPYRYVKPPAGATSTKTPTIARAVVSVRAGHSGAQFANSGESGPQISVYVPPGALQVPAGATSVTVTATPLAPTAPLPADGTIVSNVYRIAATAGGQPVPVIGRGAQAPTVQMRTGEPGQSGPVFERRTSTGWQRLATIRVGNDIYQVVTPTFGDFALVHLTDTPGASKSGGINVGLLVAGIVVLVVALIIIAIRMRRSRAAAG